MNRLLPFAAALLLAAPAWADGMTFARASDYMRDAALVLAEARACHASDGDLGNALEGALRKAGRPQRDRDALLLVTHSELYALGERPAENCGARMEALRRLSTVGPGDMAQAPAQQTGRNGGLLNSVQDDAYWILVIGRCSPDGMAPSVYALDHFADETRDLPYAEKAHLEHAFAAGQERGNKAIEANQAKTCATITPQAHDRFIRLARKQTLFLDPR